MKTAITIAIEYLEKELKDLRFANEHMVIMQFGGREYQLNRDIGFLKTLLGKEKIDIQNAWSSGLNETRSGNQDSKNYTREDYFKQTFNPLNL